MSVLLELRSVVKSRGSTLVLNGVSLAVGPAEMIVVRGRSGVGKTTLARIAALLEKPDNGRVVLLGEDVTSMGDYASSIRRLRYIGYVDQHYMLIPELTVLENVVLPLRLLGIPKSKAAMIAKEVLARLALKGFEHRLPVQLSGGQRQRAALAVALAKNPRVLVADEPYASLDDETAETVEELIRETAKESGVGVLITTTDLYKSFRATRCYILHRGKLYVDSCKKNTILPG